MDGGYQCEQCMCMDVKIIRVCGAGAGYPKELTDFHLHMYIIIESI